MNCKKTLSCIKNYTFNEEYISFKRELKIILKKAYMMVHVILVGKKI